jgi:hypothetical protein
MNIARRVVRWVPRIAVVTLLFALLFGVAGLSLAGDGSSSPPFPIPTGPGGTLGDTTHDTTHPLSVQ